MFWLFFTDLMEASGFYDVRYTILGNDWTLRVDFISDMECPDYMYYLIQEIIYGEK